MKDKTFLNRQIYDSNTNTWRFPDGSGVVPDEMRIDLECASEQRNIAGHNGLHVLSTLFKWKDRLKSLVPQSNHK